MSCFLVDRNHISYLVTACESLARRARSSFHYYWRGNAYTLGHERTTDDMGQILWRENWLSVAHRYPTAGGEMWPEDGVDYGAHHTEHHDIAPLQVIRSCDCYEYQACEHPGWKDSEAETIVGALRHLATLALMADDETILWGAPPPDARQLRRLV